MTHMTQTPIAPIAETLFLAEPIVRLIGGRHRESGRIVFPCPSDEAFEPIPLSPRGTLWSYTVQRFRPKTPPYRGPEAFEPFALGYVELAGEVIVETRIVDVPFEALEIGMPMVATAVPLGADDGGEPRLIYAFTADQGAQQ